MVEANDRIATADWRARFETKIDRLIKAEDDRQELEAAKEKAFNSLNNRVVRLEDRLSILTVLQLAFSTVMSSVSGFIASRF